MRADLILSRVSKSKQTGKGSWLCSCPAHDDRNASMTLRETDDGMILMHCFAGCDTESILSAMGMQFSDLYPERQADSKPQKMPFNPRDVLAAIGQEALVIALAAIDLGKGKSLTDDERSRVMQAAGRILTAAEVANV